MPALPRPDALHPLVFPDGTVRRQMANLAAAIPHLAAGDVTAMTGESPA